MTWQEKAEVFERALSAAGGDVAEALRALSRANQGSRRRKVCDVARADMRRRRAAGEKWAALAVEYGVCESVVRYHCRGVRRPPVRASGPDPRIGQVAQAVAAELGLAPSWLTESPIHRGKPPGWLTLARRAAALVLAGLGVGRRAIGRALFRDPTRVFELLRRAGDDAWAGRVAAAVRDRVSGEQAGAVG